MNYLRYYQLSLIKSTGRISVWSLNTLNNPTPSDPPIPTHILLQKCVSMALVLYPVRSIFPFEYICICLYAPITQPIFTAVTRINLGTGSRICWFIPNYRSTRFGTCISTFSIQIIGVRTHHIWAPAVHIGGKLCRTISVYGFHVTAGSNITSNSLL